MSQQDRQKQTEKFVGCILSVKMKPGQFGDVQHIIGTVREIDVDSAEQAIVLDQAMCNGQMLPDGYVLLSSQIADLQVMGKANEIQENYLRSAYSQSEPKKSQNVDERNDLQKQSNVSFSNGSESLRNVNGNHLNSTVSAKISSSATLMNSITSAVEGMAVREKAAAEDGESGRHPIAKPKPRKPGDGSATYASSPQDNKGTTTRSNAQQQSSVTTKASFATNPAETNKSSTNVGLSSGNASMDGGNILLRTFGNFSNSGLSNNNNNGQALLSSNHKTVGQVANVKQNVSSPSKASPQKPVVYDHKKLGVLSQFVSEAGANQTATGNEEATPQAIPGTPTGKVMNNTHQTPRNQNKHSGRQQQRHGETFESMTMDEMSVEFDFEGSNAQFEKLPVSSTKPTKVTKNPQFSNTDTTYLADRVVESVTLRESVTSVKQFVTDTGVRIPSVDLSTRSKILNLAHTAGLTHSRVVEIMGRAVAQACIPLFGDSYRLSPERVEDRPWVLVCAGPHWQGAIGIAAARILASLGVHTCVLAPKEELQLCAAEELLYNLSGEMFSRQHSDFKGIRFDLVIMAMDDHLSRNLSLAPFSRWLKNCPVVFVDPPLISSYRQQLDTVCGINKGRKIVIVSPVLPIAYPTDSTVKIFLVNLGIPNEIFQRNDVNYKSPFGDKLVIQIFSSSSK